MLEVCTLKFEEKSTNQKAIKSTNVLAALSLALKQIIISMAAILQSD